jgi:transketolase
MVLEASERKRLQDMARRNRERIVEITEKCGGGHVGGALSQTDILVALYYKYMKIDPKNPNWPERDRFVLSKGHGGIGYAALLGDLGYFNREDLKDFNKMHSPFGMHLDCLKVRGVDASTGSLGHGLGIAVGMAIGARLQGMKWHTYCLVGDGECNEGSIWEAAMSASHYKLSNLITIVDRNGFMMDGPTEQVMALEPFADKWRAFGFKVLEINGHDFDQISDAIEQSLAEKETPVVIIAKTVKGKGVDFMENKASWHYAVLDSEMATKALESIRKG